MEWTAFIGPGVGVVLLSGIVSVAVALIGKHQAVETALPEHFTRELARMQGVQAAQDQRMESMQVRLDLLAERNALLADHIDVLEAWIVDGKAPPPPPRPIFGGDRASAR